MARALMDYSTITFDCYGTLIDCESGIWDALQPLLYRNGCLEITRNVGLEAFAEIESAQQTETPEMVYDNLLAQVHMTFAKRFGLKTDMEMDHSFGASVPHWPAFPDTADALRVLKKHFKLVILSNVSRDGFAASNRKLGVTFDAIYTAQDVGSYKPNPANFSHMLEALEIDHSIGLDSILHTAQSLFHDHIPAKQAGLDCAWIDQQRLSEGGYWGATARVSNRPEVDFLYFTMGEFAQAVWNATQK